MFFTQTSDVFHTILTLLHVWCSSHKSVILWWNLWFSPHKFSLHINLWISLHKHLIFSPQNSDFLHTNLWCSSHKFMNLQLSLYINLWISLHKPLIFSPQTYDFLHTNLWFSPHKPLIFSPQTYDFLHQFKHTLLFLLHLIPVKSPAEESKNCNSYTCQSNKRQGIRNKSLIIVYKTQLFLWMFTDFSMTLYLHFMMFTKSGSQFI